MRASNIVVTSAAALAILATSYLVATAAPAATDAAATDNSMKAPAKPKPAAAPAKTDDLNGTWIGVINQVGRAKPYAVALTLKGKTGQSSYADQHCTGQLTRAGASGDYTFYVETITAGKLDAAGKTGCIDGSLTLIRSGTGLILGWSAAYAGKPIIAYGTLAAQTAPATQSK